MKNVVLTGKPYAGCPLGQFDEGGFASSKSKRGPQIYRKLMTVFAAAIVAAMSCTGLAESKTWWVDCNSKVATEDGSKDAPFKTIQAAIDAPTTQDDDTVMVLPGVYKEGGRFIESSTDGDFRCRVYIDKKITLKSTKGAAETEIVGERDNTSSTAYQGMGPLAVRCIGFSKCNFAGVVVNGFTFRDGYSNNYGGTSTGTGSDKSANYGGGICAPGYTTSPNIEVSDCVISGCAATRGAAAAGVMLVRCFVTQCSTYSSTVRYVNLYNCVVSRTRGTVNTCYIFNYSKAVCCTVVENEISPCAGSTNETLDNCVLFGNQWEAQRDHSGAWFNFCIIDADKNAAAGTTLGNGSKIVGYVYASALFAPAIDDYTPVKGGVCDGVLSADRNTKLPAAYRGTDFFGKPRTTGDVMCAGAIEGGKTAVACLSLVNNLGALSVDGHGVLVRSSHINSSVYPEAHAISVIPSDATKGAIALVRSNDSTTFFPDYKDRFWVSPVPLSVSQTASISSVGTGRLIYVDDDNFGKTPANGTLEHPYGTIQDAVDAAADADALIKVLPGYYREGGKAVAALGSIKNRVAFTGGGAVVLQAVNGPDETFVCGESDAESTTGDGRGANAVRCFGCASDKNTVVTGFTVCGGRVGVTEGNKDGDDVRGGAAYCSKQDKMTFFGCMISNNLASRGGVAFGANAACCRITENDADANALFRWGAKIFNCQVWRNGLKSNTTSIIGQGGACYNCTIVDNKVAYGVDLVEASAYCSVVQNPDAEVDFNTDKGWNCIYGTATDASATTLAANGCEVDIRCFANSSAGDYRLLSMSKGCGKINYGNIYGNGKYPIDVFLNPYVGDAEGKNIPVGAIAKTAPGVMVTSRIKDSDRQYDGQVSPCGAVCIEGLDSLTLTPTGKKPLRGYEIDGEFVKCEGPYTVTIDQANPPKEIAAVYSKTGLFIVVQ